MRSRFVRSFLSLATGGDWANAQSAETRRNLVWFWFDGLFASASDNIINTYLVIYILALGASQAQIGMMSSLSSLSAALMLLPGALLVERIGRRRNIVLGAGVLGRSALLLLGAAPLLFMGPAAVTAAIAMSVLRDASANLSFPAWMSLTADVVPLAGRGRYFASRNFIMGLMGIATTFLVGLLITHTLEPTGYQISIGLAFLFGLGAIFSFGHISDRPQAAGAPKGIEPAPAIESEAAIEPVSPAELAEPEPAGGDPVIQAVKPVWGGLAALMKEMSEHREFATFAGITALWNFSINVAGPFFNVYLVQNLHADAAMVGLTSIASSLATMLAQRKLGELNDRWGSHRLTVLSGLLIPVMPLAWVFIDSPLYVIPINMVGGVLWGAYGMGSFNYLLTICPESRRARYSALFQIVVTLSLAVGAAAGSLVVPRWGFVTVFGLSAAGRLITAGLFAALSRKRKKLAQAVPVQP